MIVKKYGCCGKSSLGAFGAGERMLDPKTFFAALCRAVSSDGQTSLYVISQALCEAGFDANNFWSPASKNALSIVQALGQRIQQLMDTVDTVLAQRTQAYIGMMPQAFYQGATCGKSAASLPPGYMPDLMAQLVLEGKATRWYSAASYLDQPATVEVTAPCVGANATTGLCPAGQDCVNGVCKVWVQGDPPPTPQKETPAADSSSYLMLAGLGAAGLAAYLLFGKKKG